MLVVAVSLRSAFSITELLPYVSPERRVKSSRLKREDDVRRSLIGDIMVRLFAMDIEGLRNEDIRFEQGVFGKPRIQQLREPWEYNISHSGKWVTSIVGRKGQRVGIDVQRMDEVDPSLIRYSMSPGETKHYFSLPAGERKRYFYELWTRKESYLKMEGVGITAPIRSVFSDKGSLDYGMSSRRQGTPAHYFKQYAVDGAYTLTACSTDFRFPEECTLVKANDLAEVFLRRCREQSMQSLLGAGERSALTKQAPVLNNTIL